MRKINIKHLTIILAIAGALISCFALVNVAFATSGPGGYCSSKSDCNANLNCIYNTCLVKPFSSCNTWADCSGGAENLMGCFDNQCLGRHFYPCGNDRNDPVCAPGFHCDISNPRYHYCEGNHIEGPSCSISANPLTIQRSQSSTLTWTSYNAISCSASNGWSGTKPLSGSQTVSPYSSTTFALSCSNSIGALATCSVYVSVTEPTVPELEITKSVDVIFADPGDEIIYTLNYSNTGSGTAHNVVVRDPFENLNQNYLTFLSSTPSPAIGYSTWHVNDLGAGQSGTITIRARISSSVPIGTTEIKNRANIDSDETSLIYSNYVSTWVSKETHSSPSLSIYKSGRNLTRGGSSWVETVYAEPGDEIEFQIKINSTGDESAQNVRVHDYLPYKLNYVYGSTSGATTSNITDSWINIGGITNGSYKTIYFRAEVAGEDHFSNGTTTLTNTAKTYADDVDIIVDSADVNVAKEEEPDFNPSLSISKSGRNLTRGGSSWLETVYAEPGDEIEFQIRVNSNGETAAQNVKVRDELPYKLSYVAGSTSGATTGNITYEWRNIGTIYAGNSKTIYFRATVANDDNFSTETTALTNTARTYADDVNTISDTARVEVNKEEIIVNTKAMTISKLGRNISTGQTGFSDYVSASPGNIVEFSIQVANTGNATLNNVKVWDALPSRITYVDDTCLLDGSKVGDGIAQAGLLVGDLSVNQNKTIRFQVQIASSASFEFGAISLTNYGYANATNLSTISDSAVVTVSRGQVLGVQTGPINTLTTISIISFLIAAAVYLIIKKEKEITIILRNLTSLKLRLLIVGLRFKEKYL